MDQFKTNTIIRDIKKINKESNCLTNQELIGLRNAFHGMVVKFWIGEDFNNKDDRKYNEATVKESALFYRKC